MGDLQVRQEGGLLEEEHDKNPKFCSIESEKWGVAEERAAEIIRRIQPTVASEMKRKAVIEYVQRLIATRFGAEVFAFGSVPLKTYLPDGDIDLSTFSQNHNGEDALPNNVRALLEEEEKSGAAEFVVRNIQCIQAEVKLVKCMIENMVVDISFNQIGGLCTLCFLEEVDRLIAKDHLFKRSIILIKAWCYHESRILGAHHSLISTYALETLVLYVFNLFHPSLTGPLQVLHKFLDYFSKFDWEKYCLSLNGPIPISSLPNMSAEAPETAGYDLLLTKEFLKSSVAVYSVPLKPYEKSRAFQSKSLNVVDPLKENNNLGRSVSRGNFFRIRSALSLGARQLGQILLSSEKDITKELDQFFANTWSRHGSGNRLDVQDIAPDSGAGVVTALGNAHGETGVEDQRISISVENSHSHREGTNNPCKLSKERKNHLTWKNDSTLTESTASVRGTVVSVRRPEGGGSEFASSRSSGPRAPRASAKFVAEIGDTFASSSPQHYDIPYRHFSRSNTCPGKMEVGPTSQRDFWASESLEGQVPFWFMDSDEQVQYLSNDSRFKHLASLSYLVENVPHQHDYPWRVGDSSEFPGSNAGSFASYFRDQALRVSHPMDVLSDLTGDLVNYTRSLTYGRICCEYSRMSPSLASSAPSTSYSYNNPKREGGHHSERVKALRNGFHQVPFFRSGNYYPAVSSVINGYSMEELPRAKGIGTYFPNWNIQKYIEKQGLGNRPSFSAPKPQSNGRAHVATVHVNPNGQRGPDMVLPESTGRYLSQANGHKIFGNGYLQRTDEYDREELQNHDPNALFSKTSSLHESSVSISSKEPPEHSRNTFSLEGTADWPKLRSSSKSDRTFDGNGQVKEVPVETLPMSKPVTRFSPPTDSPQIISSLNANAMPGRINVHDEVPEKIHEGLSINDAEDSPKLGPSSNGNTMPGRSDDRGEVPEKTHNGFSIDDAEDWPKLIPPSNGNTMPGKGNERSEILGKTHNGFSIDDADDWPKLAPSCARPVRATKPNDHGKGLPRTLNKSSHTNRFSHSPEGLEFGSLGCLDLSLLQLEKTGKKMEAPSSSSTQAVLITQESLPEIDRQRPEQSYHLKDEDFPPLAVQLSRQVNHQVR